MPSHAVPSALPSVAMAASQERKDMVVAHARRLGQHYAALMTALFLPVVLLVLALGAEQYAQARAAFLAELAQTTRERAWLLAERLPGAGSGVAEIGRLLADEEATWIVDAQGRVLAGGGPWPLGEEPVAVSGLHAMGDRLVQVERLGETPLHLVAALPASRVPWLVLPRLGTFAAISLALLATILAVQLLLHHRFIGPALALVRHIQEESEDRPSRPAAPPIWAPWFEQVSRVFARGRDAQARLATSEARLRAAADSIPDGLAIFDAEDRLVFYNSTYPDHLTANVRATLALGKNWRDWGREALALGPIYHPEMGEDYLATRVADRDQPTFDREHRLIDGRWVRVREARMPDGGRVLLTTDVTAERQRRREQMLLERALAQAGDSVEITNSDYRLTYVNPAFTRLTGYTAEEALGRTPAELLRSTFHDQAFFDGIEAALRAGRSWAGRIVSRHRDGHPIHQDATISPILDEHGRVSYSIAVKRDISAQIEAEAALEESRRALQNVLEAALDCFIAVDEAGRITEFNPAAERTFGYARAEAIGRSVEEVLIPPRLRAAHVEGMAGLLASGRAHMLGRRIEMPACRKDGTEIPVEMVVAETRRDDRAAFIAYMRDLSEQKQAEAALRASEARFLGASESIPDGLLILDAEDRIVYYNSTHPTLLPPALREVLRPGIVFGDWLREGLARGPVYHPDMGADYVNRRLATRRQERNDREHRHADGRWVRVRENAMPDGGRVLLTTDITEQREAEEKLRASEARFLAAAESIPDGLAIFDAQDRFAYFNSRYPRHLNEGLRAALRLGVKFEDWLEEGLAHGPIYHPDMGEGFLAARLAMHRRDHTEHEHKLMDGRWLRIRESRMPDGGRVLLTTDVTQRRRRERELRQLAMAVEQVGDPVEITDAHGRLTYVNPAFARVTGYAAHEVLGREPQSVLGSGRHEPAFFAEMKAQLARGEAWSGLIVNRRRDGELIYQATTISPLRDASGEITHFVAVKRDVTEQEKAKAALSQSEARYRAVVEGQSEFILRLRPNGTLTFVNEAYCRYRGMSREEMLDGFNDVYHYPPEGQARIHAAWAGLTPEFPSVTYELAKPLGDGSVRWEEWTDTAIFAPTGKVVEYQAIGRDITERKQAEQALRESEARWRSIAEGVPLPIAITATAEHRVLFANAKAREVFGVESGTQGREAVLRIWADPAQREEVARRIAEEGLVEQLEVRMRRHDGHPFDALLSARPVQFGGRSAVLGVVSDITERRRIEEALKASEARLAAFMENAPVGMYLKDRDGRYLMANPEMGKVFGRPAEEMIGRAPEDVFAPDEVAMIRGYDEEILSGQGPTVREEFLPELDAYAWSMVIRFPIRNEAGEIVQIGGFDVDITAIKQAQAEIAASEQRFRTIAEMHPTPMIITRLEDRRVMFANRAFFEAFKLTPEQLEGFDRRRLYQDPAERDANYAAIARGALIAARETTMRTAEGDPFPCAMTARGIVYEGSPCCVTSFLDLSALKRAEAALRLSEQRFRSIAEAHPMPLVIVRRADGTIRFANEPFLRLFALPAGDLSRLSPAMLYADPSDRKRLMKLVTERGAVEGVEFQLRRADGRSFPAAVTSRQIDYEGEAAFVTSVVDLTDLKAAEAEIMRQREALLQSEKLTALGSLLAGVAHELNNPLSVVVGYAAMLKELAPDDPTRKRAERVHAAAERCARIVKTFLAMARSRPPQRGPVTINEVAEAALELAAYGLRTADIEVVRELACGLPPVWGDADQLHQVLTNLIVNAQHALTQQPTPRRLRVSTRRSGPSVLIEVEDNGAGMSEEVQKRIFEPFFTTKPQGVGTGVGLSVCHGIVTAHDGQITLRSAPGAGSCFAILLPEAATFEEVLPEGSETAVPTQRGRVLVVDDEPDIAELVATHLRRDGLSVAVVGSGRAALARLAEEAFDVIVSDLRMPDLDGRALIEAVGRDYPALARRIVLITGDALGAASNEAVRQAQLPVLEKPLDLAALRQAVARLLEAA